ncbi:glycoside hydrolase family 5 protein [Qipengyuania sp. JC766]|uniref:glycoside hydrolase family 5 protein n=1 Tax=Qipengyuania sp. JC766 TaxID=3232139 RepID=UPI00345A6935
MVRILTAKACVAALCAALASAQPVAASQTGTEAAPLPVGTCINMGNSLEPEREGSWGGKPIAADDFARIKAAGFDTVRIPVRWHNKTAPASPWTVDPEWMDRVQTVVDQALAADLNVILNSHHFEPIHDDPLATAEWHGAVWRQIAERFEGYPEETLWFELENEPHRNFDHSNLLQTLAPALRAVRETHPTRAVIYGGENWSGIDSLATLPLPDDPHVHPTFHYYDPFAYTHQGASWTAPDMPPPGRRYPAEGDREQLARDVQKIRDYVARTGKTPFMGEVGAYDLHSPTQERATYHRAVREAFEPAGVGMCVWAYANTYPFWDREKQQWLPGMRAALGLPETD